MAQYNCRIYLDTGFNAVNIPDSPALLDMCAHLDGVAINVMQNRFFESVRVRVSWDDIKDADYIRIGTSDYYFITAMKMLANDCCELSVLYDFVTSAGGPTSLNILDGVTTRVHVTDDSFGKYCEEDPLTMPAQPLELQLEWMQPNTEAHTYVEATVNLAQTAGALKGISYLTEEGETVTVPTVKELTKFTEYELAGHNAGSNPHTMLYDLNDNTGGDRPTDLSNREAILKGMKRCRELGIEQGAIINQVQIPIDYAVTSEFDFHTVEVDSDLGDGTKVTVVDRSITKFEGKTGIRPSSLQFQYTGATNNRLNYGEYTKYGLITCSGESCEYNAEDLKDTQYQNAPALRYLADPHTDGKPYFRWRVVNNSIDDIGFFKNCVTGLQWKQIPLFYKDPSGTAINRLKYQNSRLIADTGYTNEYRTMRNAARGEAIGGGISAVGNIVAGNTDEGVGNIMGVIGGGIANAFKYGTQAYNLDDMYAAKKHSEMSDYLVKNTVVAPQIDFPFNSEVMRDFYGNGCLMYRYKYSSSDIQRIDKLLTMYGYRYTKALETSDFNSKQKFNYVECANVSVTGSHNQRLPKWMCDGIAAMLKNGIRVWHKLPDPSDYINGNPNR